MGALFRARQVTIWTDVDGVYSADLRKGLLCDDAFALLYVLHFYSLSVGLI